MPPLPRIRTAALAELARQLRFVPRETLRKQAARAEELAWEIEAEGRYPEDWVVFRVTGYRAEVPDPAVLTGSALVADLSAFVERLSGSAPRAWSELTERGGFIDAAGLAARWRVSRKTLDRWRRRGLIAQRALTASGRPCLVFSLPAVERFEARHGATLTRAGAFSRIPAEVERRMVRRAAVYRRRLGCTLNQAAARLARRYGRSHEAVRQVLRRAAARAPQPIFTEPGPPDARERRLIDRAARRGVEPAAIARRLERSVASVRRVIVDARASRLRLLGLDVGGEAPAPLPPDLERSPAAAAGFGVPGETDLLAFIEAARAAGAPSAAIERARAEACRALEARAAGLVASLPEHGASAVAVDEAETLLRWAARLRAELVRGQLAVIVRAVESSTGRKAEEIRSGLLAPLVETSIGAAAEAVRAFCRAPDQGRLGAPVGLAVARVASRLVKAHPEEFARRPGLRASARLRPGVAIADWTLRVAPWQPVLEPAPAVRAGLAGLDERTRALLIARFGWGGPPRTIRQLAGELGTTVMRAAILERRAIRDAARRGAGAT